MTDNRMALLERAEKGGDVEFLRERVREVVHELMEAEVSQYCGAERHERSEQRQQQRNGYRTRRWDTRVGSMGRWPFLWRDATYVKVREHGRMVSRACVIAVGVNTEGRREVLGLSVGPNESHGFWKPFLRELLGRGLAGVERVISDAHQGRKRAVGQVLAASWQRCRVHFMRDILSYVAKRHQGMVAAMVRTVFAREEQHQAREQLRCQFPEIAEAMDEAEDEVLAHMACPAAVWSKISSTNPLERVNKEIKRREPRGGHLPQ